MRVEDFMTRRVVTVTPDTSILSAARLMLDNHVSGLPVVDASAHVVGIISEVDLLREDGKSADGSPWLQMVAGTDGLTRDPVQLGARKVDEMTRSCRASRSRLRRMPRSRKPAACWRSIASSVCR